MNTVLSLIGLTGAPIPIMNVVIGTEAEATRHARYSQEAQAAAEAKRQRRRLRAQGSGDNHSPTPKWTGGTKNLLTLVAHRPKPARGSKAKKSAI